MASLTSIVGGCFAFGGFCTGIDQLINVRRAFENAVRPIENDAACKKVLRVAAEVLYRIGYGVGAIGCIVLGVGMINVASSIGFFAAIFAAATAAMAYFAASLGCLTAAALSSVYGGTPAPLQRSAH